MKKILLTFVLIFSLLFTAGCKKEKEFTMDGLKVTLDSSFVKREQIGVVLAAVSTDKIFTANRQEKSQFGSSYTLSDYYDACLMSINLTGEHEEYKDEEGNIKFLYGYYNNTADEQEYGYMLVVLEGNDYFYAVNFGTYSDKLDSNKDKFLNWAKTIVVE